MKLIPLAGLCATDEALAVGAPAIVGTLWREENCAIGGASAVRFILLSGLSQ